MAQSIVTVFCADQMSRVNIGNARLYGLESDLNMVGNDYLTAVSLYVRSIMSDRANR